MIRYLSFLILFTITLHVSAQQSEVFAGFQMPLFYTAGYQQQLGSHFSITGQVGILTTPFDKALMKIMNEFDADQVLVNTIGDAFSVGIHIQPTLKWHFHHFYIGASYSWLRLVANDCPADLIQNYYGISLPSRRNYELTMKSDLHNAGLVLGKEFCFNDSPITVNFDFMVLKTFASKSCLANSSGQEMDKLSEAIDMELDYYYVQYGFLPSLNLTISYRFESKQ